MNVKRFVGKNAREAMAQARAAFGDQTVILSNRPVRGGVEMLAMASAEIPDTAPRGATFEDEDIQAHSAAPAPAMSTLSFQEFVRERQQREAAAPTTPQKSAPQIKPVPAMKSLPAMQAVAQSAAHAAAQPALRLAQPKPQAPRMQAAQLRSLPIEPARFAAEALELEIANAQSHAVQPIEPIHASAKPAQSDADLLAEIKAMRSMLSSQIAGLSWFDTVRRSPLQTQVLRLLVGNGFSTQVASQLVERVPADFSETQAEKWLAKVLTHNLHCPDSDSVQQRGGVFALVGPTGVGKTTTTAKLAANFAMEHGAASVGLITVDTYRMAASDQLRAFGGILNIPVHTARDSASLVDLLDLLSKKKLVLIDTVGVGQRDRRLTELFAALPANRIKRLVVLNSAAQAETLDEVVQAYSAGPGTRCAFTKLDEAVKCGAAIDVALRHQLRVEGFANGQRVPEDWHGSRAHVLVQKALMKPTNTRYTPDDTQLAMMFGAPGVNAGAHLHA